MKTRSLEILEKSELPAEQARAILTVMEMEMVSSQETLATKVDLANFRAEVLERFGKIDARFGEQEGRLIRWVFTCILGQSAVLGGLGWFLLAHFRN
jgi:hypothetical protein